MGFYQWEGGERKARDNVEEETGYPPNERIIHDESSGDSAAKKKCGRGEVNSGGSAAKKKGGLGEVGSGDSAAKDRGGKGNVGNGDSAAKKERKRGKEM
ncbi:hypothetical protein O3M35_010740 [Rhynocoris fuscipes]|uniref:Uncharacterized protein n=1 Tax=Rhynocoris fuscipes TaxID=488301 RepID=A0AAW1D3S6_9HEMI